MYRSLAGWLLIGAAIRLLLVPLALHPDLLAVYSRVLLWERGELALYDFKLQALPMLVHRLWSIVSFAELPDMSGLQWPMLLDDVHRRMLDILGSPRALISVATWKLPYALADLACGVLLARLGGAVRGMAALRMWMLHPFVLYVVCLVGKYESFMLVPLLLGLLDLRAGRPNRGFLLLGVAVAMRIYPGLLVAPIALAITPSLRRRLEYLALAAAPQAVLLLCCTVRSTAAWFVLPPLAVLAWGAYRRTRGSRWEPLVWCGVLSGIAWAIATHLGPSVNPNYSTQPLLDHGAYLTRSRIELSPSDTILLFGIAYGAVLVWAHRVGMTRQPGEPIRFDDVLDACVLACASFFAFCFFNPQYGMLLIAVAVLHLGRTADSRPAHGVQLLGVLLFLLYFGGGTASIVHLFVPMSPREVLDLPGPLDNLPESVAELEWPTFGRTLLALGCGWMAIDVLLARRRGTTGAITGWSALLRAGVLAWPVGLLLALSISVWTDRVRAGEFVTMPILFRADQPFDGVTFDTSTGLPAALEVRTKRYGGTPPTQPYLIELHDGDAPRDDRPLGVVRVAPERMKADQSGIVRLPLKGLAMRPGSRYRLVCRSGGYLPRPVMTEMRVMRPLARGEAARVLAERFAARVVATGWFGFAWLGAVLGCVVAGLAWRLGRRRTVHGEVQG
ncbi:MAG: hypothetical protein KDC87_02310 [Planctomycetes bacterium]|nr:hypothetical protein [Planctomycetota bacterium]